MKIRTKIISGIIAAIMCIQYIVGVAVFADESTDWSYADFEEGVAVTGYKGSDDDVFVPAEIDGKPVIKIGDEAFKDNIAINSVTLSQNIQIIGTSAFEGASNMVCIVTNDALKEISARAFAGCTSFNSVILRDNVTTIGADTFLGCNKLTIYCNENNTAWNYAIANGIKHTSLDPDAQPETVEIDGISYYITNGEAVLMSCDKEKSGDIIVPALVDEYPVIAVNAGAFTECENIISVKLPDSVRYIGRAAFERCSKLKKFDIPKSISVIDDYVFADCTELKSIIIPDGVTKIGIGAFIQCSSLEDITIPDSVTELGGDVFIDCISLKEFTMPNSVLSIGSNIFYGCTSLENVTLSEKLTTLTSGTFNQCTSLQELTIPDGVIVIEDSALYNCSSLIELNIPKSVRTIESNAIVNCQSLAKLTINEGIHSLGDLAFNNCRNLREITIPSSVSDIKLDLNEFLVTAFYVQEGSFAYNYLKNNGLKYIITDGKPAVKNLIGEDAEYCIINGDAYLTIYNNSVDDVIISDNINGYVVTGITDSAFSGKDIKSVILPETMEYIGNHVFSECHNLLSVLIPDSVTYMGEGIFSECRALESVNIPANISTLPQHIFGGCVSLKAIELHDEIKKICNGALFDCASVTELVIPDTVTEIEEMAFAGCANLETIKLSKGLTVIERCFEECRKLSSVYIPESIEVIADGAFEQCQALKTLKVPSSVKSIGRNSFPDDITLYVKDNSYAMEYAIENNIYYILDDTEIDIREYTLNGITYTVIDDTATVTACDPELVGDIIIEEKVDDFPVTKISKNAFEFSYYLNTISLPQSIVEIEEQAFRNCSMISISIPSGVKELRGNTFYNCKNLKTVGLSEGLVKIGPRAFCNSSITSIEIPSSVKEIGDAAFEECRELKNIKLPPNLTKIGEKVFKFCGFSYIDIPSNVQHIGQEAFYGCFNLESITIPNGISEINDLTFAGCDILDNVSIPSSVKKLGIGAFYSCTSLKSIEFNELELEAEVFADCKSLETVSIPECMTSIPNGLFQGCTSLRNVIIKDNVTSIGDRAFMNCQTIKTLNISDDITMIGENAFTMASNLVLCVHDNTYAYQYAIENNIPYFLLPRTDNPYTANGQSVTGMVTTVRGEAVPGAMVEFIDKYGNVRETVETDETGAYTFTYAEVGAYIIRAEDVNGRTGSDNFSIRRKNVFETYLLGNTDITVLDYLAVTGTVTNERGAVIADAEVSLIDETGMVLETVQTNGNGVYTFPHVTNGSYTVRADKDENTSIEPITIYTGDDEVNEIECNIVIRQGASVSGSVVDEEGKPVVWAEIIVTDMDGERVASIYTDKDGAYEIDSLPLGSYSITAVFEDINTRLVGVAAFEILSIEAVTVPQITAVYEHTSIGNATIYGKVTAHGQQQISSVILRDVFMNEIAVCNTEENGKYKFTNIADGVYTIIATTESNGAGFTSVVIKDGELESGNTSITVYKTGTVDDFETQVAILPEVSAGVDVIKSFEDGIIKANNAYNSLSKKDKQRVSEDVIDKLHKLIETISSSGIEVNDEGTEEYKFEVKGLETVISDEEIKGESEAQISLDIAVINAENIEETTAENLEKLDEKAENEDMAIVEYFDIDLTKSTQDTEKDIKNITKDSVGTGTVQITLAIPEEERGHENYSMLHLHNGEVTTLVDIDNNPDTITFETDKFSQYALAYDDNVRAASNDIEAKVVYDSNNKAANITSDQEVKAAIVIFAAYSGGQLVALQVKETDLKEGENLPVTADKLDTTGSDSVKVMIWRDFKQMIPVFDQ